MVQGDLPVSIIIVNYNAGRHLGRCLSALAAQSFRDFEALVVDNASTDDSFEAARQAVSSDPRFVFMRNPANIGFAAANNGAAARARGRWLAFLNPDAFAEADWLGELLAATRRHPGFRLFGSTQIAESDPSRLDGAGDCYALVGLPWRGGFGRPVTELPRQDYEVFSVCAAAALIDAALFRRLGGFDEAFFCYCEDVDLGFRARLHGERCAQVPAARVHHVGGASLPGGAFARYYGMRNAVLAFTKNMPAPLFWPMLLPMLLATACVAVARPALAGAGLRGLVAAGPLLGHAWRARRRHGSRPVADTLMVLQVASASPAAFWRRAIVGRPIAPAAPARLAAEAMKP